MSIEYYSGVPGVCIEIKTPQDLFNAIDILHSQTMDAFGDEHNEYLPALEMGMDYLTDKFGLYPE